MKSDKSRLDPKSICAEGCRFKTETLGKSDTIPVLSPDSSVLLDSLDFCEPNFIVPQGLGGALFQ